MVKIVLLTLIATVFGEGEKYNQQKRLNLGALLDLSGTNAYYGKYVKEGILLASKEINDPALNILFEDHKLNSGEAVKAFHKLATHTLRGIFTMSSMSSVPLNPLSNKHGILQLAVIAWANNYSTPDDNTFRLDITTDKAAEEVCRFFKAKQFQRVALASIKTAFGESMSGSVLSNCSQLISFKTDYLENEKNLNTIALKLIQQNPDIVYIIDHRPAIIADFLKRLRTQGYKGPYYSGTLGQDEIFIKNAGDLAEGTYYIYVQVDENKINNLYEKEFGGSPLNPYLVASGYEGLRIFYAAFKPCNFDIECARKRLYQDSFDTVFGRIKFDKNGDAVGIQPQTRQIKNGKFQPA